LQKSFNVIPAGPVPEVSSPGAGIQVFQGPLDRGCHRSDDFVEFCKRLRIYRIYRIERPWTVPSLWPFFPVNPVNPVQGS
jgi:hypothetical protein